MNLFIILILLIIYTGIIYAVIKCTDEHNFIIIPLIISLAIVIQIEENYYYKTYEYQKPIERIIIKYDENNTPIDTVYIHPNL